MSSRNPFRVTVFTKAFQKRGGVARIRSLTATPRDTAISTCEWTIDADAPRVVDLMAPGARAVVHYDGAFLMSGVVALTAGEGPSVNGTRTFTLESDYRLLYNVLGYQNPSGTILQQDLAGEYYTVTGPAETVVKHLITVNAVERLGLPVIVAPDLGRGAVITVSVRMHRLADKVITAADQAGIGITVRQHPTEPALLVDCYERGTYPRRLTERSGAVKKWRHVTSHPTTTRTAVMGFGEGLDRVYREVIDSAREAEYGDVIEVARDARDVQPDSPDWEALLLERGAETLAEGAPTAGLEVELAETPAARYGRNGLVVGTTAQLEIGYGITVTDVLRSAVLTWKTGGDTGGVRAAPQVGAIADDPNVLIAQAIRKTAAAARDAASSR